MAVYLQNIEILPFYDIRRLRDLLTDDGTGDDLTETDISTNTLLTQAILWACGEIDMKAQNGLRYTSADLETLATDPRKGATLRKLTADLAFGFLAQRRGQAYEKVMEIAPAYEGALMRLDELYEGRSIFSIDANLTATVPTRKKLGKLFGLSSKLNEMFGVWPDDNQPFNYCG